jgi:hypothetical protein
MDFTKFVAMLEHHGLFFVRADHFRDSFEGSYPRQQGHLRVSQLREAGMKEGVVENVKQNHSRFNEWIRHWILVSSWHMNDDESAAMWSLYARTNEAIAVRTRYTTLKRLLPPDVLVGIVKYIDYAKEWIPEGNLFYPFVHKRQSFAHERELRAVIWETDFTVKDGAIDWDVYPREPGRWVPIPLDQLILEVRVAPDSQSWFQSLVQDVVRRYDIDISIVRSSLDDSPFF